MLLECILVTARKRSLRRLCFYRCLSVHRGDGEPPLDGGTPPRMENPPWMEEPRRMETPLDGDPPRWRTPSHRDGEPPLSVNVWAVRILLECILVEICEDEHFRLE